MNDPLVGRGRHGREFKHNGFKRNNHFLSKIFILIVRHGVKKNTYVGMKYIHFLLPVSFSKVVLDYINRVKVEAFKII